MGKTKFAILLIIILINIAIVINNIRFINGDFISLVIGISIIIFTKIYFSSYHSSAKSNENLDELEKELKVRFEDELRVIHKNNKGFKKPTFYRKFTPSQKEFKDLEKLLLEYQSKELSREIEKWWSEYFNMTKLEDRKIQLYFIGFAIIVFSAISLFL